RPSLPSSASINPYPFASLNHLTLPETICISMRYSSSDTSPASAASATGRKMHDHAGLCRADQLSLLQTVCQNCDSDQKCAINAIAGAISYPTLASRSSRHCGDDGNSSQFVRNGD